MPDPIPQPKPEPTAGNQRPNESAQFNVDDFVRISDPQTQEILVQKRN